MKGPPRTFGEIDRLLEGKEREVERQREPSVVPVVHPLHRKRVPDGRRVVSVLHVPVPFFVVVVDVLTLVLQVPSGRDSTRRRPRDRKRDESETSATAGEGDTILKRGTEDELLKDKRSQLTHIP